MKLLRKRLPYSVLLVVLLSFFLLQCKSVDITFLGLFKKKVVIESDKEERITENKAIELSEKTVQNKSEVSKTNIKKKGKNHRKKQASSVYGTIVLRNSESIETPVLITLIDKGGKILVTESDKIHQFELTGLIPDTYSITAELIGFAKQEKTLTIDSLNQRLNIDFKLIKLGAVCGKILKSDKQTAIPKVLIVANSIKGDIVTAQSDQKGVYKLRDLQDGKYTVKILSDLYYFPEKVIEIQNGTDVEDIIFTPYDGVVKGTVYDFNHKPLKMATVKIQSSEADNSGLLKFVRKTIQTDEYGRFTIESLPPGKYHIQISAKGFGLLIKTISIPKNKKQLEQEFKLLLGGGISGRIKGMNRNETVEFLVIDENRNLIEVLDMSIKSDGNYLISGLSSGIYTIVAKWKNFHIPFPNIKVSSGKTTIGIDIALQDDFGSVSGQIYSKTNEPVSGVIVFANSEFSGNFAISNHEGKYQIKGLKPGSYEIMISTSKGQEVKKQRIEIKSDLELDNVNFILK